MSESISLSVWPGENEVSKQPQPQRYDPDTQLVGLLMWVHSCLQEGKGLKRKNIYISYPREGWRGRILSWGAGSVGKEKENNASGWKKKLMSTGHSNRDKISQCRASASWQPLLDPVWRVADPMITFRSESCAVSKLRWWIFLMNWIPECAWRVEADKGGGAGALISSQKLAAAFSWPAPRLRGSCAETQAPETTIMSSRTSELNKVISVQHVSKCSEKKKGMNRWTDLLVPFPFGESYELFCSWYVCFPYFENFFPQI